MDSPTGSSCGSTNSDHPILPKKRDTPIAYLTRCETFSAGHRLLNTSLDESTNRDLFGKCTNFHGHNYKVEVTVRGPVNKISGMVMDVGELRDIMTMVIEPLDHRHLDQDIDYFQLSGKVATAENIAIFLWDKIKKLLPNETTLTNLRLHETDKHFVDYKGELEDDSLDPEINMKFICVDDFEKEAFKRLPKESLGYYASGADEEVTLRANVESFKRLKILPRFLRDVSRVDMRQDIFGQQVNCPIGASPSAMHKLAHPDGELATASGLSRIGTIMTLSTLSTTSIEDVAQSNPDLIKWFQLYLFTNRDDSVKLIRRAEMAGFKALVLTVDAPKFGTRRRDIQNNFKVAANFLANFDQSSSKRLQNLDYIDASIKWTDVTWLKSITKLPILIKGIMTVEDSLMALEYNADGIVVSNHGGRQLDGVPATIQVLPMIARAINGRCPIFVDGGVRTGSDVFKCLALGAKMVFVGRPILWGLTCDGARGVEQVMRLLRDELELTMKLSGCPSLKDISSSMVIHESQLNSKL